MSVSSAVSFHIHDTESIDARCELHSAALTGGYLVVYVGDSQVCWHGKMSDLAAISEQIGKAIANLAKREREKAAAAATDSQTIEQE